MDKEVEEDMLEQDTVFDVEEDMDDPEQYGSRIRRRSYDSEDSMNGKSSLSRQRSA